MSGKKLVIEANKKANQHEKKHRNINTKNEAFNSFVIQLKKLKTIFLKTQNL
jgi:hypothetical protein